MQQFNFSSTHEVQSFLSENSSDGISEIYESSENQSNGSNFSFFVNNYDWNLTAQL